MNVDHYLHIDDFQLLICCYWMDYQLLVVIFVSKWMVVVIFWNSAIKHRGNKILLSTLSSTKFDVKKLQFRENIFI
jgi:hypothetical protein